MYLNLLHRPSINNFEDFIFQQELAHHLSLKVTLMIQTEYLENAEIIEVVKKQHQLYGDEIGLWFTGYSGNIEEPPFTRENTPLWLYPLDIKRKLIEKYFKKFNEVFGVMPVSAGAYHIDAKTMDIMKEVSPETKIVVAGCFEEGVKVFHGCNNSWYLFNEGMPWTPWYPSKTNTLRPAKNQEDSFDIIAVPHLIRDLALSYEGRNDFFASHPTNVQRGMANIGEKAPYSLNLIDMYRFQERYNDDFSYCHVFVGPNWLSGNPNIHDSDEVTRNLYVELLEYFAELKTKGKLIDMYMAEFAVWFKGNIPYGKPQVHLAKEMLYGSGKHYFWYCDSAIRLLIDMKQGGSIGDLRPFISEYENHTGPESKMKAIGSYPYLIQSQYRSGASYHYTDGSRTTLLLGHNGEIIDLCKYPTKVESIDKSHENIIKIRLSPVRIQFDDGLAIVIVTTYIIDNNGRIFILRSIIDSSNPNEEIKAFEYVKACYGFTEYPEDMGGIKLFMTSKDGEITEVTYEYRGRTMIMENIKAVSAIIPQINTKLTLSGAAGTGKITEGHLFSPYYTLSHGNTINIGQEMKSCLQVEKLD